MVRIRPFNPYIFADNIVNVISPPFDSISEELESRLKQSEHNITHLTLPETHADPGEILDRWISEGVLQRLPGSQYVILDQTYSTGESCRLTGIVALANIFPDDGSIRPHEKTFPRPISERIRIMKAASAQLEPVYLFVDSSGLESMLRSIISDREPGMEFVDLSGVHNRVYFCNDAEAGGVADLLAGIPAVVADGHHRTAASRELAIRTSGEEKEFWSWIMAYIVPLNSSGLKISGIHRYVDTTGLKNSMPGWRSSLIETRDGRTDSRLLAVYDGEWHTVSPSSETCSENADACLSPVHTLNSLILESGFGFTDCDFQDRVSYTHSEEEAVRKVDAGLANFAAVIPDWDKNSLMGLILNRGYLPQKSTYFYPKPPSGMFINALRPHP